MSEWREVRLGDLCYKVCSGGTPKSTCSAYYDGGIIPWLNTKEINYNRIYQTESHITEEGLNNSSAKWIDANSVIVAMYGATAGRVAVAKVPMTTNQACCNLMIDKTKADYDFIYYYLSNSYKHLLSMANGAAQQNLNAQVIKDFIISLPDINEQHSIASFLSALDDKIAINRRICENLEAQAQALFKHWFIDFAPFKNGKFIDSELGLIPEGWRVVTLDEATSKFGTGLNPRKNFKLGFGNNYYVTIKNMIDNRVILDNKCDFVDDEAIKVIQKRSKLAKGDLLFSGIGTIGRVAMVVDEPLNWNTSESVFNMHPAEGFSTEFLYVLLLSKQLQNYVKINSQGAVQQGIRMAALKAYKFPYPKYEIKEFNLLLKDIISKKTIIEKESDILAQLRDTLLPKLMSGEIKV